MLRQVQSAAGKRQVTSEGCNEKLLVVTGNFQDDRITP